MPDEGGWEIFVDGQPLGKLPLNFQWNSVRSEGSEFTVKYTKLFKPDPDAKFRPRFLVLPPSWTSYSVYINGMPIREEPIHTFAGNIYERKIIPLPYNIPEQRLFVELLAFGDRSVGGFRDDKVRLISTQEELNSIWIENFFMSRVHTPIAILSLVLIFFISVLMGARTFNRKEYWFLIIAIATSLPYTFLSTDFYNILNFDPITPFKLQQAFQIIMWISILLFFLLRLGSERILSKNIIQKKAFIPFVYIPGVLFAAASTFIPTATFFKITSIIFPILSIVAFISIFLMKRMLVMQGLYAAVLISAGIGLYSELVRANIYPFAYAFLAVSMAGALLLLNDIKRDANLNAAVNGFVNQFLPNSTHPEIISLVEKGHSNEEIARGLSQFDVIGTVLIDICEWGKLNVLGDKKFSSHSVMRARAIAFSEFESIMEKFDFELIKTSGDNMKFSCGLYVNVPSKERWIAERVLRALPAVLDALYGVNSTLRAAELPTLEIKLSATMGQTAYGIERYASRGQFDTQGHFVNMAYRLEAAMDSDFYQKLGRNCALVSEDLFQSIQDPGLTQKFIEGLTVADKHGMKYSCRVLTEKGRINPSSVSEAMTAFFQPFQKSSSGGMNADMTKGDTEPANNANGPRIGEKRKSVREKAYFCEKYEASIMHDGTSTKGKIIDFNHHGLGVAFPLKSDLTFLNKGEVQRLSMTVLDQTFDVDAQFTRVFEREIGGKKLQVVGFRIFQPQSLNQPRKSLRYDLDSVETKPIATIKQVLSLRNTIRGIIVNLSSDAFAVETKRSHIPLIQGMQVWIRIDVPYSGEMHCKATLLRVDFLKSKVFRLVFEISENRSEYLQKMGHFLISCNLHHVTPVSLKNDGFKADRNLESYKIKYAESEQDLYDICQLRLKVYNELRANNKALTPEEMADPYDAHSRHIMIYHGERLICVSRIVFNCGDLSKSEHMQYKVAIPDYIQKKGFVEFSRAAVDREYRGGDVFFTIIYHFGRITYENGYTFALVSCNEALYRKIYKRIGFRRVCDFTDEQSDKWILAVVNVKSLLENRTIAPIGWELFMKDLVEHFNRQGLIKTSFRGTVNKLILKSIRPMVRKKIAG